MTEWFGAGDRRTKAALEPSMDRFTERRVRVFRPSWGPRRLKIDLDVAVSSGVTVTYTLDGRNPLTYSWDQFDHALLRRLLPMRDFARRLEQENKPVAPWLHTTGHLVGAESHHERTLMMLADYHPAVQFISGQPFTLVWPKGSDIQSHTPDVLLLREGSLPLIVDVRTPAGARDAKWAPKVPSIESAVRSLGMGYLIWTGMSRQYRRNLENFTEARVPAESYQRWSDVASELCTSPMPASELANLLDLAGYQRLWALTLIRRMLWRRALQTDMYSRFSSAAIVEQGID
ncbi:hypothetical protein [Cryobacterium sp. 10I5]|uniref:hypothetical protein n=1 Tax=Cryobacterium sp. 10I5 TaxID=3048581 RepID=UPI002B23406E|nr:hypothetical protein [Cryobacterium sp. 10I5]MEB0265069.1 hypothetical protein [Cryobacterium sp. 10I5]